MPPPIPNIPRSTMSSKIGSERAGNSPATSPREIPEEESVQDQQGERGTPKKKSLHKIKNFEWGLIITVAVIVDIIQIVLTFFLVGIVINRFITIAGIIVVPVFFYWRGIQMDSKKWTNIVASAILEFIPIVDLLPAWTRLVVRIMFIDKAEEKLENAEQNMPGGHLAGAAIERKIRGGQVPSERSKTSGQPKSRQGEFIPQTGPSVSQTAGETIPYATNQYSQKPTAKNAERGNTENNEESGKILDTPTQFSNEKPSDHVVDLRHNPRHERIEKGEEGYKEAA